MEKTDKVEHITNCQDPFALFPEAKLALTMRLHSTICAIKSEIPFIAINYSPKVKGILKDAKFESALVDMNNVSLQTLKNHLDKVVDTSEFNEQALRTLKEFEQTILDETLKA